MPGPSLSPSFQRVTDDVLRTFTWTRVGWFAYWGAVGLCGYGWSIAAVLWWYQMRAGLHVTGLDHPVMWGVYIASFVFWIGIAHSGTFISAILFLFRATWRTAIARAAETMTIVALMTAVIFPVLHLGRAWRAYWLIPYPNERGLWINFSSPLIWDAVAIATYFLVSVLFWYLELVPDFAVVRDRSEGRQRRIFRLLALGWSATAGEWRAYRKAYGLLAAVITALVVSVHSIVSWDFAAAILPGWHSTIFAPYFVAGAILSGLAMVLTLIIPARALLGAQRYITIEALGKVAGLIVALSLILTYSYVMEAFFALRGTHPVERDSYLFRVAGPPWPLFWTTMVCVSIAPLMFLAERVRRSLTALFCIGLAINAGMWIERLMIVTTSLAHDFDPYVWGVYRPTVVELAIVGGSGCWFLFWFLLLLGHIPAIPIAETKENMQEAERA
ncbi:MAG TPA: NrfD/PsrC family molybdoenzyme membrane anchor subunit [Vicinamibacterales bacterium]|nr:NrfD/PsrC family molybdoenzyme membrane anchor subunit [Vicinamibacterales bacterium]